MSPLQIKIMLHYYAIPTDWEDDSDASAQALGGFIRNGMLGYDRSDTPNHFITHKGQAYVNHILAVPIPVETTPYTFPGEQEE